MKRSSDYGFVAYLTLIKNIGYDPDKTVILRRGKAEFYFDLSGEQWKQLKEEYRQSGYAKYNYEIKSLKDLSFS